MPRSDLGRGGRIVAAVLAVIWLATGAVVVIYGFRRRAWFAVLLGVPALVYGGMWIAVARTGQRLRWRGRRPKE